VSNTIVEIDEETSIECEVANDGTPAIFIDQNTDNLPILRVYVNNALLYANPPYESQLIEQDLAEEFTEPYDDVV